MYRAVRSIKLQSVLATIELSKAKSSEFDLLHIFSSMGSGLGTCSLRLQLWEVRTRKTTVDLRPKLSAVRRSPMDHQKKQKETKRQKRQKSGTPKNHENNYQSSAAKSRLDSLQEAVEVEEVLNAVSPSLFCTADQLVAFKYRAGTTIGLQNHTTSVNPKLGSNMMWIPLPLKSDTWFSMASFLNIESPWLNWCFYQPIKAGMIFSVERWCKKLFPPLQ